MDATAVGWNAMLPWQPSTTRFQRPGSHAVTVTSAIPSINPCEPWHPRASWMDDMQPTPEVGTALSAVAVESRFVQVYQVLLSPPSRSKGCWMMATGRFARVRRPRFAREKCCLPEGGSAASHRIRPRLQRRAHCDGWKRADRLARSKGLKSSCSRGQTLSTWRWGAGAAVGK